jgi:hypothetical protein
MVSVLPWYFSAKASIDFLSFYPCVSDIEDVSDECLQEALLKLEFETNRRIDAYLSVEVSVKLSDPFAFFGSKIATCAMLSDNPDSFWSWVFGKTTTDSWKIPVDGIYPTRADIFNSGNVIALNMKFGTEIMNLCANTGDCHEIFSSLGEACRENYRGATDEYSKRMQFRKCIRSRSTSFTETDTLCDTDGSISAKVSKSSFESDSSDSERELGSVYDDDFSDDNASELSADSDDDSDDDSESSSQIVNKVGFYSDDFFLGKHPSRDAYSDQESVISSSTDSSDLLNHQFISDDLKLSFHITENIGEGAFAVVFLIELLSEETPSPDKAVLKLNKLISNDPPFFESLTRDIDGMRLASRRNFEFLPKLIDTLHAKEDLRSLKPIDLADETFVFPGIIMEYVQVDESVNPDKFIFCNYIQAIDILKDLLCLDASNKDFEKSLVLEDFHSGNLLNIEGTDSMSLDTVQTDTLSCPKVKLVDTGTLNTLNGALSPTFFSLNFPIEVRKKHPKVYLCWYLEQFHRRFYEGDGGVFTEEEVKVVTERIRDILRLADCSKSDEFKMGKDGSLNGGLHRIFLDTKAAILEEAKAKKNIYPIL